MGQSGFVTPKGLFPITFILTKPIEDAPARCLRLWVRFLEHGGLKVSGTSQRNESFDKAPDCGFGAGVGLATAA